MNNSKIIQITAGNGPIECEYVVAQVLKIFLKEAKHNAINTKIITKISGKESRTIQSISLQLTGKEIAHFLRSWLGTIQWVGVSTLRKNSKPKNWFIGCFLLEEINSLKINENDISYQAVRSSGAGGQHVNKVSSAVRAIHQPTNIQVFVSDTRSQHKNKQIALKRLKVELNEYNYKLLQEKLQKQQINHFKLDRGSPVRIFEGSDFKKHFIDKSYKKDRSRLKINLRKQSNFED